MVYRGKPSAGCETCRKAKKRCDLQQPACSRCVKLKKTCGGYRDTTQLQIQDESEAVMLRATRQKPRTLEPPAANTRTPSLWIEHRIVTPATLTAAQTPQSDSSSSGDEIVELPLHGRNTELIAFNTFPEVTPRSALQGNDRVPDMLIPSADDIAATFFFNTFTARSGHWNFLREYGMRSDLDPVLNLAIRACGVAALDNLHGVVKGREHSRSLYGQALALLNKALRDPVRSKTDESLIAVSMLGYFENITCDSRESIRSWKAHIRGAAQLLLFRGTRQFETSVGRMLYRETRASILVGTIWDDLEPPAFLLDWNDELARLTPNMEFIKPGDDLSIVIFDISVLRYKMSVQAVSDAEAYQMANDLEMRMVDWSIKTMERNDFWGYTEIEVPNSPHVWNGMVHAYSALPPANPVATIWQTYRTMRILLTRTQELLCRRFGLPAEQEVAQISYFKSVRRQMTDDICSSIPCQLGHAAPAYNSPCVLVTAYASIWPLFFAATCTLERIWPGDWTSALQDQPLNLSSLTSSALAQTLWILGRFEYISVDVGLRWADGVAATIRGDFNIDDQLMPEYGDADSETVQRFWKERLEQLKKHQLPDWIKEIQSSGRGPKILIEDEDPRKDTMARSDHGPIWLGGGRLADIDRYNEASTSNLMHD